MTRYTVSMNNSVETICGGGSSSSIVVVVASQKGGEWEDLLLAFRTLEASLVMWVK